MRFKAVIFDLDGTLCELRFQVSNAKKAVIKDLSRLGFDTSEMSPEEPTQSILDKVAVQLHRQRRSDTYSDVWNRFDQILTDFEMEAFRTTTPLRGAKSTLKYLIDNGFKLALVTNNGVLPTKMILKKLSFSSYFKVVITRREVGRMKPGGQGIKLALKKLRVKANQALYVGDSYVDVRAARDAGVRIASLMRLDSASKILKEEPDYIMTTLPGLIKIVGGSKK